MLETLSDADKQRFQLVVTNREDAMQPLNVDSLIARLLTDSDDSPVGIRVWTPVTDEIPAVDETLLAPGTSPTGEASIGMLTLSDSASSSAYVVSFSTGSPLDTVAWLESFSETNRGLDPLISDSRWGIDSPEDPTAAGRSRRTPDPTRETPAENPQVAADETVPVP